MNRDVAWSNTFDIDSRFMLRYISTDKTLSDLLLRQHLAAYFLFTHSLLLTNHIKILSELDIETFRCSIKDKNPSMMSTVMKEKSDYICPPVHKQITSIESDLFVFFVFGASGNLARKKIYPTLWWLYRRNLLPKHIYFIGYARSKWTIEKIFENSQKYMKIQNDERDLYEKFFKLNYYVSGSYEKSEDFQYLNSKAIEITQQASAHRLFYLALPPSVYVNVSELISRHCRPEAPGWIRLIVEKPFGKDLQSSNVLSEHLSRFYAEEEIYRIDHYLGKEMVQNIMTLRFSNRIFSHAWNRDSIAAIKIIFKENIGTQGRGGYFDEFGIIRDVIQNHLMQILSIIALEEPRSTTGEDIRDEKVKVLRCIAPIKIENVVIGQYIGDPESTDRERQLGYLDDKDIPKDSTTPTYAQTILYINNDRWDGVPFILRAGKALNERKAEIRIQFRDIPNELFNNSINKNDVKRSLARNELIIRIQPDEAVYLKINTKRPGEMSYATEETELDLTYNERYRDKNLPDAYERLILDVFTGSKINFVRVDEVQEAWRIVDPILAEIDKKRLQVFPYKFGAPGLPEAFNAAVKHGYVFTGTYVWKDERSASHSNAQEEKNSTESLSANANVRLKSSI